MVEPTSRRMAQLIAELASLIARDAKEEGLSESREVGLVTNLELSEAEIYAIYDGAQLLLEN